MALVRPDYGHGGRGPGPRDATPQLLTHDLRRRHWHTSAAHSFYRGSALPARRIQTTLQRPAPRHPVELVLYPGTGHLLDLPEGGTPKQRLDRERRSFTWIKKY